MEAQALRAQGWTISAIARHLGVTRLTVRRHLRGERVPGQRARAAPDPFEEFVEYCRLRLSADPHLWATTLFDEVTALGYRGSYPLFTRALRARELRPVCGLGGDLRGRRGRRGRRSNDAHAVSGHVTGQFVEPAPPTPEP